MQDLMWRNWLSKYEQILLEFQFGLIVSNHLHFEYLTMHVYLCNRWLFYPFKKDRVC
jgi:hypothetical protein